MNTSTFNTEIKIYTRNQDGQLNWESPKVVNKEITIRNEYGAQSWEAKVRAAVRKEVKNMTGERFYFYADTACKTKVFSSNY